MFNLMAARSINDNEQPVAVGGNLDGAFSRGEHVQGGADDLTQRTGYSGGIGAVAAGHVLYVGFEAIEGVKHEGILSHKKGEQAIMIYVKQLCFIKITATRM